MLEAYSNKRNVLKIVALSVCAIFTFTTLAWSSPSTSNLAASLGVNSPQTRSKIKKDIYRELVKPSGIKELVRKQMSDVSSGDFSKEDSELLKNLVRFSAGKVSNAASMGEAEEELLKLKREWRAADERERLELILGLVQSKRGERLSGLRDTVNKLGIRRDVEGILGKFASAEVDTESDLERKVKAALEYVQMTLETIVSGNYEFFGSYALLRWALTDHIRDASGGKKITELFKLKDWQEKHEVPKKKWVWASRILFAVASFGVFCFLKSLLFDLVGGIFLVGSSSAFWTPYVALLSSHFLIFIAAMFIVEFSKRLGRLAFEALERRIKSKTYDKYNAFFTEELISGAVKRPARAPRIDFYSSADDIKTFFVWAGLDVKDIEAVLRKHGFKDKDIPRSVWCGLYEAYDAMRIKRLYAGNTSPPKKSMTWKEVIPRLPLKILLFPWHLFDSFIFQYPRRLAKAYRQVDEYQPMSKKELVTFTSAYFEDHKIEKKKPSVLAQFVRSLFWRRNIFLRGFLYFLQRRFALYGIGLISGLIIFGLLPQSILGVALLGKTLSFFTLGAYLNSVVLMAGLILPKVIKQNLTISMIKSMIPRFKDQLHEGELKQKVTAFFESGLGETDALALIEEAEKLDPESDEMLKGTILSIVRELFEKGMLETSSKFITRRVARFLGNDFSKRKRILSSLPLVWIFTQNAVELYDSFEKTIANRKILFQIFVTGALSMSLMLPLEIHGVLKGAHYVDGVLDEFVTENFETEIHHAVSEEEAAMLDGYHSNIDLYNKYDWLVEQKNNPGLSLEQKEMAAVVDRFTMELPELLDQPDGLDIAEERLDAMIEEEATRFKGVHAAVSAIEVEALGLASHLGDPLLGRDPRAVGLSSETYTSGKLLIERAIIARMDAEHYQSLREPAMTDSLKQSKGLRLLRHHITLPRNDKRIEPPPTVEIPDIQIPAPEIPGGVDFLKALSEERWERHEMLVKGFERRKALEKWTSDFRKTHDFITERTTDAEGDKKDIEIVERRMRLAREMKRDGMLDRHRTLHEDFWERVKVDAEEERAQKKRMEDRLKRTGIEEVREETREFLVFISEIIVKRYSKKDIERDPEGLLKLIEREFKRREGMQMDFDRIEEKLKKCGLFDDDVPEYFQDKLEVILERFEEKQTSYEDALEEKTDEEFKKARMAWTQRGKTKEERTEDAVKILKRLGPMLELAGRYGDDMPDCLKDNIFELLDKFEGQVNVTDVQRVFEENGLVGKAASPELNKEFSEKFVEMSTAPDPEAKSGEKEDATDTILSLLDNFGWLGDLGADDVVPDFVKEGLLSLFDDVEGKVDVGRIQKKMEELGLTGKDAPEALEGLNDDMAEKLMEMSRRVDLEGEWKEREPKDDSDEETPEKLDRTDEALEMIKKYGWMAAMYKGSGRDIPDSVVDQFLSKFDDYDGKVDVKRIEKELEKLGFTKDQLPKKFRERLEKRLEQLKGDVETHGGLEGLPPGLSEVQKEKVEKALVEIYKNEAGGFTDLNSKERHYYPWFGVPSLAVFLEPGSRDFLAYGFGSVSWSLYSRGHDIKPENYKWIDACGSLPLCFIRSPEEDERAPEAFLMRQFVKVDDNLFRVPEEAKDHDKCESFPVWKHTSRIDLLWNYTDSKGRIYLWSEVGTIADPKTILIYDENDNFVSREGAKVVMREDGAQLLELPKPLEKGMRISYKLAIPFSWSESWHHRYVWPYESGLFQIHVPPEDSLKYEVKGISPEVDEVLSKDYKGLKDFLMFYRHFLRENRSLIMSRLFRDMRDDYQVNPICFTEAFGGGDPVALCQEMGMIARAKGYDACIALGNYRIRSSLADDRDGHAIVVFKTPDGLVKFDPAEFVKGSGYEGCGGKKVTKFLSEDYLWQWDRGYYRHNWAYNSLASLPEPHPKVGAHEGSKKYDLLTRKVRSDFKERKKKLTAAFKRGLKEVIPDFSGLRGLFEETYKEREAETGVHKPVSPQYKMGDEVYRWGGTLDYDFHTDDPAFRSSFNAGVEIPHETLFQIIDVVPGTKEKDHPWPVRKFPEFLVQQTFVHYENGAWRWLNPKDMLPHKSTFIRFQGDPPADRGEDQHERTKVLIMARHVIGSEMHLPAPLGTMQVSLSLGDRCTASCHWESKSKVCLLDSLKGADILFDGADYCSVYSQFFRYDRVQRFYWVARAMRSPPGLLPEFDFFYECFFPRLGDRFPYHSLRPRFVVKSTGSGGDLIEDIIPLETEEMKGIKIPGKIASSLPSTEKIKDELKLGYKETWDKLKKDQEFFKNWDSEYKAWLGAYKKITGKRKLVTSSLLQELLLEFPEDRFLLMEAVGGGSRDLLCEEMVILMRRAGMKSELARGYYVDLEGRVPMRSKQSAVICQKLALKTYSNGRKTWRWDDCIYDPAKWTKISFVEREMTDKEKKAKGEELRRAFLRGKEDGNFQDFREILKTILEEKKEEKEKNDLPVDPREKFSLDNLSGSFWAAAKAKALRGDLEKFLGENPGHDLPADLEEKIEMFFQGRGLSMADDPKRAVYWWRFVHRLPMRQRVALMDDAYFLFKKIEGKSALQKYIEYGIDYSSLHVTDGNTLSEGVDSREQRIAWLIWLHQSELLTKEERDFVLSMFLAKERIKKKYPKDEHAGIWKGEISRAVEDCRKMLEAKWSELDFGWVFGKEAEGIFKKMGSGSAFEGKDEWRNGIIEEILDMLKDQKKGDLTESESKELIRDFKRYEEIKTAEFAEAEDFDFDEKDAHALADLSLEFFSRTVYGAKNSLTAWDLPARMLLFNYDEEKDCVVFIRDADDKPVPLKPLSGKILNEAVCSLREAWREKLNLKVEDLGDEFFRMAEVFRRDGFTLEANPFLVKDINDAADGFMLTRPFNLRLFAGDYRIPSDAAGAQLDSIQRLYNHQLRQAETYESLGWQKWVYEKLKEPLRAVWRAADPRVKAEIGNGVWPSGEDLFVESLVENYKKELKLQGKKQDVEYGSKDFPRFTVFADCGIDDSQKIKEARVFNTLLLGLLRMSPNMDQEMVKKYEELDTLLTKYYKKEDIAYWTPHLTRSDSVTYHDCWTRFMKDYGDVPGLFMFELMHWPFTEEQKPLFEKAQRALTAQYKGYKFKGAPEFAAKAKAYTKIRDAVDRLGIRIGGPKKGVDDIIHCLIANHQKEYGVNSYCFDVLRPFTREATDIMKLLAYQYRHYEKVKELEAVKDGEKIAHLLDKLFTQGLGFRRPNPKHVKRASISDMKQAVYLNFKQEFPSGDRNLYLKNETAGGPYAVKAINDFLVQLLKDVPPEKLTRTEKEFLRVSEILDEDFMSWGENFSARVYRFDLIVEAILTFYRLNPEEKRVFSIFEKEDMQSMYDEISRGERAGDKDSFCKLDRILRKIFTGDALSKRQRVWLREWWQIEGRKKAFDAEKAKEIVETVYENKRAREAVELDRIMLSLGEGLTRLNKYVLDEEKSEDWERFTYAFEKTRSAKNEMWREGAEEFLSDKMQEKKAELLSDVAKMFGAAIEVYEKKGGTRPVEFTALIGNDENFGHRFLRAQLADQGINGFTARDRDELRAFYEFDELFLEAKQDVLKHGITEEEWAEAVKHLRKFETEEGETIDEELANSWPNIRESWQWIKKTYHAFDFLGLKTGKVSLHDIVFFGIFTAYILYYLFRRARKDTESFKDKEITELLNALSGKSMPQSTMLEKSFSSEKVDEFFEVASEQKLDLKTKTAEKAKGLRIPAKILAKLVLQKLVLLSEEADKDLTGREHKKRDLFPRLRAFFGRIFAAFMFAYFVIPALIHFLLGFFKKLKKRSRDVKKNPYKEVLLSIIGKVSKSDTSSPRQVESKISGVLSDFSPQADASELRQKLVSGAFKGWHEGLMVREYIPVNLQMGRRGQVVAIPLKEISKGEWDELQDVADGERISMEMIDQKASARRGRLVKRVRQVKIEPVGKVIVEIATLQKIISEVMQDKPSRGLEYLLDVQQYFKSQRRSYEIVVVDLGKKIHGFKVRGRTSEFEQVIQLLDFAVKHKPVWHDLEDVTDREQMLGGIQFRKSCDYFPVYSSPVGDIPAKHLRGFAEGAGIVGSRMMVLMRRNGKQVGDVGRSASAKSLGKISENARLEGLRIIDEYLYIVRKVSANLEAVTYSTEQEHVNNSSQNRANHLEILFLLDRLFTGHNKYISVETAA